MTTQKPNDLFSLYKGNIALFLAARAKNPSAYDYLLPQVQQQINNFESTNKKFIIERRQALDTNENIALWQTWFAIRQSMQEAADKMAIKDKLKKKEEEADNAYKLRQDVIASIINKARDTLNPQGPKEEINMLANGYCSDLSLLVKFKVVSQGFIDILNDKINNNDRIAVGELEFLKRGDITNKNKTQFEATGCSGETDKNRVQFIKFALNDAIPANERNKTIAHHNNIRKIVFECTSERPRGNPEIPDEQRSINVIEQRSKIHEELLAKRKPK